MKPSKLKKAISRSFHQSRPIMIWGPPGVGKSDIIKQIAEEEYGGNLVDLRLPQIDPVDLRGIPSVVNGKTDWNTPKLFPTEGTGILFLDEIVSAVPATQTVAYQLTLDRKVGDYALPKGWVIAAAGNRAQDRAIVHRMPTPLANRFMHFELEADADDWVDWAIVNGIHPEVIAFIRYRPALLHDIDFDAHAFPTPRSWEAASDFIGGSMEHEMLSASIGEATATEFLGFSKIARNLPDIDDVIANPRIATVPTDTATLFAMSSLLAHRANEGNIANVTSYLLRIPPDYQIIAMRDILKRNPDLLETEAVCEWIAKNEGVLI